MSVFMDTSALYAVLDAGDANHKAAAGRWARLLDSEEQLVTSNYVVLEVSALVQHRMGVKALRTFHEDVMPAARIVWVTEQIHNTALAMLFLANRRRLSLTDCVSFEIMRSQNIRSAFAFDPHFREFGFKIFT